MTTPDLKTLETLTRDYATFQARKSGLATALGGLLAVVLVVAALSPNFMGIHVLNRLLVEFLVWVPLLWLVAKSIIGPLVYRGLGPVRALTDVAYERRRWRWILGLALFLLAVLLAALYAFASGRLVAHPPQAALQPTPMWILVMPFLYLLAMPWAIRGIEEARAYVVLVGQCMLWLIPFFIFSFGPPAPPLKQGWGLFGDVLGVGILVLIYVVLIWGALAMVRGWKEHREYLAILRRIPVEEG
ncbi:hypothetical protein GETHLI_04430 [Geothrix limicola]|uniref:Uncharacterized protein n=1 Tax=Geothrix limicola TaxID=2927978 RepID=A0ABQ5QBV6_9BACT|nr:hypothetical protein [Geothrix limicola]GLH71941.1 hypothetical protein GETHLI_04430 [Geothrix limicola]